MIDALEQQSISRNARAMENEAYCPGVMLNFVRHKLRARNDFDLSLRLDCSPVDISRIRHHRKAIGDMMLLRISEATEIPTKELKRLAGMIKEEA